MTDADRYKAALERIARVCINDWPTVLEWAQWTRAVANDAVYGTACELDRTPPKCEQRVPPLSAEETKRLAAALAVDDITGADLQAAPVDPAWRLHDENGLKPPQTEVVTDQQIG